MTIEVFQEGTPENERYTALRKKVMQSGWQGITGGAVETGRLGFSLFLQQSEGRDLEIEAVTSKLGLRDNDGSIVDGYWVTDRLSREEDRPHYFDTRFTDYRSGVYVDYSGQFDERVAATFEAMASLANPDSDELLG